MNLDPKADGDTAVIHALVKRYGGHSVDIVRGDKRLVGWSPDRRPACIAITDLREILSPPAALTTGDVGELVERLKKPWDGRPNSRAERDDERNEAATVIQQQAQKIAEYETVLKPLAEGVNEWDGEDRMSIWEHPIAVNITLGDLRRARALLTGESKG